MQSRRAFLKALGIAGSGLILPVTLTACSSAPTQQSQPGTWQPNAWLRITPDNEILFYLDRVEMGQGTMTGLTTLIGEELNTAPHLIKVVTAPVHKDFINPNFGIQITGGSTSLRTDHKRLRTVAAEARERLRAAAALRFQVNLNQVQAIDGYIEYNGTRIPFGQLADSASQLSTPKVKLKSPSQYRFIGKPGIRLDAAMKSRGTGKFGIDTQLPELYIAVLKRCPVIGGTVKSWQANGADQMPRVKKVVEVPMGVAVLADSFWHAQKALEKVTVEWELPE
ncbi:MAG TPA: molybdopterin cofactor-binding domain-containing protein, partial [Dongiaceae bacterium]|nr:molybdopterin cofactor-binding domain-containing protein [Dongiaceae bacterium]